MEPLKPDCSDALRRKRLQSWLAAMRRRSSPVRFESKSCGNAPISCNFQSNPSRFLCTSDCVAEGRGFEPSVQVWMVQESTFPQVARNQILQGIWKTAPLPCSHARLVYSSGIPEKEASKLTVTARRLDIPAPPAKVLRGLDGYREDWKSFLVGGIDFPTPGCWEISAHYEDDELTFVVWVAK